MEPLVITRAFQALPSGLKAACLDFPASEQVYVENGQPTLFAGWVLPTNSDRNLGIIFRSDTDEFVIKLEQERKDVLQKVGRVDNPTSAESMVGFAIPLQFLGKGSIFIIFDGREYLWCSLIASSDSVTSRFKTECRKVALGETADFKSFKPVDDSVSIQSSVAMCVTALQVNKLNRLDQTAVDHLSSFIERHSDHSLVTEIAALARDGLFPSPIGSENAKILFSYVSDSTNILVCASKEVLFFVNQAVTSVDSIYIPQYSLNIMLCHNNPAVCGAIIKNFLLNIRLVDLDRTRKFGGYLVGHPRPYHFMYDSMMAMQYAIENEAVDLADETYTLASGAFIDPSVVFGMKTPTRFLYPFDLNEHVLSNDIYVVKVGLFFSNGADDGFLIELAERLDSKVRVVAKKKDSDSPSSDLSKLSGHFPVIWVGVTGQKRRWIEQEEGTAALINRLHLAFPGIAVVFDGWTGSISRTREDEVETNADNAVVTKIRALLSPGVTVFSVVGEPILDKVSYGNKCDFFIANYATGSMNIARVCGKPGVAHISRSFTTAESQHIHPRSLKIPKESIVDFASDENSRMDFVSYSFPWQVMFERLVDVMATVPVSKVREI